MADQTEQTANGAEQRRPKKEREPAQILADFLNGDAVRKRLADVCNKSIRPEELVRLMLLAASRQPDLLKCAQHSILRALMDAAQLGIAPMGLQGRGYIVPRKNNHTKELEATFDPGWRGLCDIARRGGLVKAIDAKVVYEGDFFEYSETESGPRLRHEPLFALPDGDDDDDGTGRIIAAYARAVVDGAVQIEVLRRRDIDRIAASSASKSGPWSTWFDEMARKSAVKRLCKYLPYSPDLDYAVRVADRPDGAEGAEAAALPARTTADLSAAIASRGRQLGQRTMSAEEAIFSGPQQREAVARDEPRQEAQQQQRHEAHSSPSTPPPAEGAKGEPALSPRAEQYRRALEAVENADAFGELWGLVQGDHKTGKITREEYDALTLVGSATERRLGVGGPR